MGSASSSVQKLKKENAELRKQLEGLKDWTGERVRRVNLLHFNDCYELEPDDLDEKPCGGAARFAAAVNRARERLSDSITVFSGDFVGPSLTSVVTKGAHIKEALDTLDVQVACIGNHEYDYGAANLTRLIEGYTTKIGLTVPGSRVKWVQSNMKGPDGLPISGSVVHETISRGGVKVGFIGLAENWLCKVPNAPTGSTYEDFCEVGERLAKELKAAPEKCDVVVALTHSRLANDLLLSEKAPSVDLILGGHDHEPAWMLKKRVVKSGHDFKYLSAVTIEIAPDGDKRLLCEVDRIDAADPEDPQMLRLIQKYSDYRDSKMKRVLGKTAVELDSRESAVRFGECTLGNFIADCVHSELAAVMKACGVVEPLATVFLAGARIKGDNVLPATSPVTLGDLFAWCPAREPYDVVLITGAQILEYLEASVKALSADGTAECAGFPHCSRGCAYTLDATAPPGRRVSSVRINGSALDPAETYAVGMTLFDASGRVVDSINKATPRVVDEDDGVHVVKALKRALALLRGDDDDDDEDDGDVESAKPIEVELGRVTVKR